MNALLGAAIAFALVGLNAWLYTANKKTPVPEGCEELKPDCGACGIRDCALRSALTERKEENNGDN